MSAERRVVTPQVLVLMVLIVVVVPFSPLLITRRWGWWEAWVYALISILGFAASRALAAQRHPDLLTERARFLQQPEATAWDKLLAPLVGLGGGLVPLVAGVDRLLGWSTGFALGGKIAALLVLLAGFVLASYALITNRFFSGMVRLQTERGHQVVTGGPYRWVRHPGYAGSLLAYLATLFLLDSLWAIVPAALFGVVIVIRTRLEDGFLQANLAGYSAYAKKVRYRLVPGVW
jgi:protein-S-isoprenylcysteine O-methyltransferase Ste14